MGNYEELKAAVASVIKANGNQEITGQVLQNTLTTLISQIGVNATFAGIATPSTVPGTPDQNVFYIASKKGIYVNFNNIEVDNDVVILENKNGSWVKKESGLAQGEIVSELINNDVKQNSFINSIFPNKNICLIYECFDMYISSSRFFSSPGYKMIAGIAKVEANKQYAFIGFDILLLNSNGGYFLVNGDCFDKYGNLYPNNDAIITDLTKDFKKIVGHENENISTVTIPNIQDSELYIVCILAQYSQYFCYNHKKSNIISIQEFSTYENIDFTTQPNNSNLFFDKISYIGGVNVYDSSKNIHTGYYLQVLSDSTKAVIRTIPSQVYTVVAIPVIPGVKYTIKTANNKYLNSHNVIAFAVRDIDNLKMCADANKDTFQLSNIRVSWDDFPNGKDGIGKTITIPNGINYLLFNGIAQNTDGTQKASDVKICIGEGIIDVDYNKNILYGFRNGLCIDPRNTLIHTKLSWCTLGDSITWINDNSNYGYQKAVMKAMTFSNYYNVGENGWKMLQYADALIDGSKVLPNADIYTIAYGINDWSYSNPVGTLDDFKNNTGTKTYAGALRVIIDKIYKININALIFIMTPRKACQFNSYLPQNWYDPINGIYLVDYVNILKDCANWFSLPIIDIFSLSQANEETLGNLCYDQYLHPNQKGCDLMAALIISKFSECLPLNKG